MDAELRIEILERTSLYLVLTRAMCRLPPSEVVVHALRGGVGIVQVREKSVGDADLIEWVLEVRRLAEPFGALVLVNDRPDVAVLADADGAHLGQDDLALDVARKWVGEHRLLGLSTHDAAQIAYADVSTANYLGFGPVFDTSTKHLKGLGLRSVEATLATTKPVYCIGGIGLDEVPLLTASGVTRVAVSSALCSAIDPESVAHEFRSRLASAQG